MFIVFDVHVCNDDHSFFYRLLLSAVRRNFQRVAMGCVLIRS